MDIGRSKTTQRNVAAQGDHHIRDQGLELYQRMCNIPGLRRKNLHVIFHVKGLCLRKEEKFLSVWFLPKGKNYVCVEPKLSTRKNLRVLKKFLGNLCAEEGGPIEVPEVAAIVLLWGLGVRKPPGGSYRRWFRIRCQNFNRTYGYGDTLIRMFADKIFPTALFTEPGVVVDPNSESVVRINKYYTFKEIIDFYLKILYFHMPITWSTHLYAHNHTHRHAYIDILRSDAYTHTYTVNKGTCPIL